MKMKNVVKKEDSTSRQFLGVDFVVLAIGKDSMVTKMLYKATDYVISGAYKLKFDGNEYLLTEGDAYSIPANVEHSFEIIEPGQVVDVFTPIRQDYL